MSYKISKSQKVIPNIPLAKSTLEVAQHNLDASSILYERAMYPEAIFFFQQAMEKGCKAYGYYFGIITESDAISREIGHKGIGVYERSIRQFQKIVKSIREKLDLSKAIGQDEENKEFFTLLGDDIDDAKKKLQNYREYSRNAAISKEELVKTLQRMQKVEQELDGVKQYVTKEEMSTIISSSVKNAALNFIYSVIGTNSSVDSMKIEKMVQELEQSEISSIICAMLNHISIMGSLLHLTLLSQPYESSTRYPSGTQSPLKIYNSQFPFVEQFIELSAWGKKTLNDMDHMFRTYPVGGEEYKSLEKSL